MKTATKRFVELIVSLALFIATVFVYAVFLQPAYVVVNELRGELSAGRQAFDEQRVVVEKVKMALQQYQDLSRIADTVSLVLPGKEAYPTLVNQLDTMAKSAGIFLDSATFNTMAPLAAGAAKTSSNPSPTTLQVTMGLIGPYPAFKDFVSKIETNVRMMDVIRFSITPAGAGSNFNYTLVANTYYQAL